MISSGPSRNANMRARYHRGAECPRRTAEVTKHPGSRPGSPGERYVLECVVNVSEGRDRDVLDRLSAACGAELLDRHADPDHHRSVFTVVGERAPRALARC